MYKYISLNQEVYRQDVYKMIDWLKDNEVSRYLNEEPGIVNSLNNLVHMSTIPTLTQHFNRNGAFYIIECKDDAVVYIKLVPKGSKVEVVITIGNRKKWGQGIGTVALKKAITEAFINFKANEIVAKIHKNNTRSKKLFKKAGFNMEESLEVENLYSLSFKEFVNQSYKKHVSTAI